MERRDEVRKMQTWGIKERKEKRKKKGMWEI